MTIARRQRRKPFIIATAFEFSTPLLSITDYGWAAWAMFFPSVEAGMAEADRTAVPVVAPAPCIYKR